MNKLFNVLVLLGLPVASSACAGTDAEESDATGLTSGEPERQPEPPGSATAVIAAPSGAPADQGTRGVGPSALPEPPVDPASDPPAPLAEPVGEPTPAPTNASADAGTPTSTPDCPAEQWTCESLTCSDPSCSDCAVWQEPMGCSCDPARPRQASDCAADEKFVCDTLDVAISERGRLSCACVDAEDSPRVACAESNPQHQTTAVDEFLCSCAWILIR